MSNTYSFIDVACSLSGPTGIADLGYGASVAKEGITLARAADINKMTIGADGRGMHSTSADKSGTVTIRLLKTSPNNQVLMQMVDAQRLSTALAGQNTIVVRQLESGDITTCSQCAFKKIPDLKYAEEGDVVDWTFDSIEIDSILGTY